MLRNFGRFASQCKSSNARRVLSTQGKYLVNPSSPTTRTKEHMDCNSIISNIATLETKHDEEDICVCAIRTTTWTKLRHSSFIFSFERSPNAHTLQPSTVALFDGLKRKSFSFDLFEFLMQTNLKANTFSLLSFFSSSILHLL